MRRLRKKKRIDWQLKKQPRLYWIGQNLKKDKQDIVVNKLRVQMVSSHALIAAQVCVAEAREK